MQIQEAELAGLLILTPTKHSDERGYFTEIYNKKTLLDFGFAEAFIQDNQAYNKSAATLRGLHYQTAPFAQDKLVRVIQGSIFDVVVDLRRESSTFGKWFGVKLSQDNSKQLLIPKGFAHGYLTLEPDTIVSYKTSNHYAPEYEAGIIWDDPQININWPQLDKPFVLSAKDQLLPLLADLT